MIEPTPNVCPVCDTTQDNDPPCVRCGYAPSPIPGTDLLLFRIAPNGAHIYAVRDSTGAGYGYYALHRGQDYDSLGDTEDAEPDTKEQFVARISAL